MMRSMGVLLWSSLVIGLLIPGGSIGNQCQPTHIQLGSQAELDAFQARYGPCDHVVGDLRIVGAQIESLQGLSGIRHIAGELFIENTEYLEDLKGLDELEEVAGDVTIFHNFALENLRGLERLRRVGGQLAIFANPKQQYLDALAALTQVGGLLGISDLPDLRHIEGLISLESVGGHLIVVFNHSLRRLDGLDALAHVGGYVRVKLNPELHSCTSLGRLLDGLDDGSPGPGTGEVPDAGGIVELAENLPGCNGLEQVRLAHTLTIDSGLSGAWFDPDIPGQGLFVSIWPASNLLFLQWATFDLARPAVSIPFVLGDPGHRWFTAMGHYAGNRAELLLFESRGGVFGAGPLRPDTQPAGTALLEFSTTATAAFEFSMSKDRANGLIALRRIHAGGGSVKLAPLPQ